MRLYSQKVVWKNNQVVFTDEGDVNKTMAYRIMQAHDSSNDPDLFHIKFDSLISHDITYVGIIQTAKASGLKQFPVPYVLTNCHNSLCAVGGTINEDDHAFGLSAAKKYGGIYVPANVAVIHQYAREMMAGCGKMILGSDSHTRYGAIGTMGVGEGGPEIVKQLLSNTYDIAKPEVILVHVTGKPKKGVGPHDVAITLCGDVYDNGFVKNKVLEFVGEGIADLPMDYRIGIDVMTTETACLSSIWQTDEKVEQYLQAVGRPEEYSKLEPQDGAMYDGLIELDLSEIEPMVALPFHPSRAVSIKALKENPYQILKETEELAAKQFNGKVSLNLVDKIVDGQIVVDQGIIAGCSGGMYDNIAEANAILTGGDVGNGYFNLSIYPPSIPINLQLIKDGIQQELMQKGALFKSCFCGPCFGAGDVPSNNGLSVRHTTRNFPNREGSKPADGQIAAVMLMDARSIAATALNHGILTGADEIDYQQPEPKPYQFDKSVYEKRCYNGYGNPQPDYQLKFGPNITEWPEIEPLKDNLLLKLTAVIHDAVTTTDELIPSGETSSYRSNPLKLAEFTLSRRVPDYVEKAKALKASARDYSNSEELKQISEKLDIDLANTSIGSAIFANRPGDGSAREQAASCQRVLGGAANICYQYATKRYRSNCINWGMLPFNIDEGVEFDYEADDYVYVENVKKALKEDCHDLPARIITSGEIVDITLHLPDLTAKEKEILLAGCLMNYYARKAEENGQD